MVILTETHGWLPTDWLKDKLLRNKHKELWHVVLESLPVEEMTSEAVAEACMTAAKFTIKTHLSRVSR